MRKLAVSLSVLAGLVVSGCDFSEERKTITVQGSGTAYMEPTGFIVSVNISTTHEDQQTVLRNASETLELFKTRFSEMEGIDTLSFTTDEMDVRPQYSPCDDGYPNDHCSIAGWKVSMPIEIHGSPANQAANAISYAMELGALDAEIEDYTIDDPETLMSQARSEAYQDALMQAELLAESANMNLIAPIEISYPGARNSGSYAYEGDYIVVTGSRISMPSVSFDLEPSTQSRTSRIQVVFEFQSSASQSE